MHDPTLKYALWIPAWFELDQPIAVGLRDRFWFFKNPPENCPAADDNEFVFFNQLLSDDNCEVRVATILSIEHPVLGQLHRIETDGLDYVIVRADETEILVNAEEEPGVTCEPGLAFSDWTVRVMLTDVSEPVADFV